MKGLGVLTLSWIVVVALSVPSTAAPDAATIIKEGFNHYRGEASKAVFEMVIHRPTWERRMQMEGWTKGTDRSLIHIIAPAKDKNNGTLKRGRDMWTYNPKINRIIKLPPSLMSQSWMGSDFSNNDLAKTDAILNEYTHTLMDTETHQGQDVYVIKSMPKPDAPVVWGMQVIKVRADHVILYQEYFDEALLPVKRMTAYDIQMMGGRMFPKSWKMQEVDTPDAYTLLNYLELEFLDDLPDHIFTANQLKIRQRR